MAIVKTIFTGQTLEAQAPALLAYLQANATNYFDTITADENGNVSCYVGETAALLFGMDGTTTRKVSLSNGQYVETTAEASESNTARTVLIKYAKKTSNGIMIVTKDTKCSNLDTGAITLVISKDESGDTCIIGRIQAGTQSSDLIHVFAADIKNDATIFKPLITNKAGLGGLSHQAPISAFTSVGFTSAHYAPKVFFTTFSQFAAVECDVTKNGKSYATDGYFALSD